MSFPPICTLFYHISFTKKDSRRRKSPFCLFLIFCHLLPPFAFQRDNQLRSAKQMGAGVLSYVKLVCEEQAKYRTFICLNERNRSR